jgi:uncharacterized cupin superfamily protein
MPRLGFHAATIDAKDLQPAPIRPEWVIAGSPVARAVDLARSPDGTCTSAQWDCTAGKFHWYFGVEETVHILEGEVVVREADGRESRLRQGDVAVMPANTWMVWHVERYVRKLAHCRYPVPRPFGKILRGLQSLRNRFSLRGGTPQARAGSPIPAAAASVRQ